MNAPCHYGVIESISSYTLHTLDIGSGIYHTLARAHTTTTMNTFKRIWAGFKQPCIVHTNLRRPVACSWLTANESSAEKLEININGHAMGEKKRRNGPETDREREKERESMCIIGTRNTKYVHYLPLYCCYCSHRQWLPPSLQHSICHFCFDTSSCHT